MMMQVNETALFPLEHASDVANDTAKSAVARAADVSVAVANHAIEINERCQACPGL